MPELGRLSNTAPTMIAFLVLRSRSHIHLVGDGAAQIKENLTNWLPVPSEFYQHLFLHVLMTLKSVTYILISLKVKNLNNKFITFLDFLQ